MADQLAHKLTHCRTNGHWRTKPGRTGWGVRTTGAVAVPFSALTALGGWGRTARGQSARPTTEARSVRAKSLPLYSSGAPSTRLRTGRFHRHDPVNGRVTALRAREPVGGG